MNRQKSNPSPNLLCVYYDLVINFYVVKFICNHSEKFIFTKKVSRMNDCVRLLEIDKVFRLIFPIATTHKVVCMLKQLDGEHFNLLYESMAEELGKKHEIVNLAVLNISVKDVENNENIVFSYNEDNGITFAKAVIKFKEHNCFLLECPCSPQIRPEVFVQVSSLLDVSAICNLLNYVLAEFGIGFDELSWANVDMLSGSCSEPVCQ